MTSEVLDKPAETEEKATQTEGEPDSTLDSEVAGGEGEAEGGDTKATPTAEDALQSFLKDRDLTTEAEGSPAEQKPQDSTSAPQVDETVVQGRVEAALEQQRRTAESEGVRQAFQNRATGIRSYLIREGFDPQKAELVVNEFNAHHAQAGRVTSEDTRREVLEGIGNLQFKEAEKYAPGITALRGSKINSTADLLAAVAEGARKNTVPEKEVKTRIKAELVAYKESLAKLGIIPGSKEVPDGESSASTGGKSNAAVLDDPNASAEQLQKAFKAQYGIDFPA